MKQAPDRGLSWVPSDQPLREAVAALLRANARLARLSAEYDEALELREQAAKRLALHLHGQVEL